MDQTIETTGFEFPGQTGVYHGKVRDVYTIKDSYLVMVATDRISAFDVVLPRAIPYKGQVLNQLAAHLLKSTDDIVPNWLLSTPHPNVSVGIRCEPFKIEMIVRGSLVGHAWREYSSGKRELCGTVLPDGLREYDQFPSPIITPSTKAETGHDEDIIPDKIVAESLATAEQFAQLSDISLQLFARGQEMARERGLYLCDTKYEFGLVGSDIYLIDEVHTPDSSRYFYYDSYEQYLNDRKTPPKHLSKEFVREWLMERGFSGQDGQQMPDLTDEFVASVSERYIELYQQLSGQPFNKRALTQDPAAEIKTAVEAGLEKL